MIFFRPQGPQVSEEMIGVKPLRVTVIECPHQTRCHRQLPQQHTQSASRQRSAVEVEEIYPVFTQQVGLYLVAVLVE
jgi:hypothetical protein